MTLEINGAMHELKVEMEERASATSLHGLTRVMERADRNERQAMRMIRNAWERGKQISQLPKSFQKRWMEYHNSIRIDGVTELRVYSGFLFIFSSGGILITMFNLPRNFFKYKHFDENNRPVRNTRQFERMRMGPAMCFE